MKLHVGYGITITVVDSALGGSAGSSWSLSAHNYFQFGISNINELTNAEHQLSFTARTQHLSLIQSNNFKNQSKNVLGLDYYSYPHVADDIFPFPVDYINNPRSLICKVLRGH